MTLLLPHAAAVVVMVSMGWPLWIGQVLLAAAGVVSLLLLAGLRATRQQVAGSPSAVPRWYQNLGLVLLGVHLMSLAVVCASWGVPLGVLGVVPAVYAILWLKALVRWRVEKTQSLDEDNCQWAFADDYQDAFSYPRTFVWMCVALCLEMLPGMHVMGFVGLVAHPAGVLLHSVLCAMLLESFGYRNFHDDWHDDHDSWHNHDDIPPEGGVQTACRVLWVGINPLSMAFGTLVAHGVCPLLLAASAGCD